MQVCARAAYIALVLLLYQYMPNTSCFMSPYYYVPGIYIQIRRLTVY